MYYYGADLENVSDISLTTRYRRTPFALEASIPKSISSVTGLTPGAFFWSTWLIDSRQLTVARLIWPRIARLSNRSKPRYVVTLRIAHDSLDAPGGICHSATTS